MLTLRWLVATSVRVAEGPSVSRALQRSAELTRGSRWRLLALCVAYAVLAILLSLALGKLGSGIGSGFGSGDRLVTAAVQILGGTIQTVITATGISVCYMQLRQLREGATPNQLAAVFRLRPTNIVGVLAGPPQRTSIVPAFLSALRLPNKSPPSSSSRRAA